MTIYYEEIIQRAYQLGHHEITECHPFILPARFSEISKRIMGELEFQLYNSERARSGPDSTMNNPLPFKVCSFEARGALCSPRYEDKLKYAGFDILALAAIEKTPIIWDIFILIQRHSDKKLHLMEPNKPGATEEEIAWYRSAEATIQAFLYFMRVSCKFALESSKSKFKVKNKIRKEFVRIKNIIHVYPKEEKIPNIYPVSGGSIDYSHRFEVRGHWRRILGIGKDRSGDYKIEGFTWIVPFIKGSDNLPLIKKTRVIHATTESRELE